MTGRSRSTTPESTGRGRMVDAGFRRGVPHPISFGDRQFRGFCLLFCSQHATLDISSPPRAAAGPSLCQVKCLWSRAPGQICKVILLIKQTGKGLKTSIDAGAVVCWYSESSFKTTKLKKCDNKRRFGKNVLQWFKLAPLH